MARIGQGPTADAHLGRPSQGQRLVNPATEAGSTVLFKDYDTFTNRKSDYFYGRNGTPTHRAFEENLCHLEQASGVELTPSGLSALTIATLSYATTGGHILVVDTAYDPMRHFCDHFLKDLGIETTYFDPLIGTGIKALIRPNTQFILCESPGSLTMEVQDLPAIIAAAGDIPVAVDNTWAAGVYLKPLAMGATLSIQALTKYVGGHSDLLMGAIFSRNQAAQKAVRQCAGSLGNSVSARDVTEAHRGLRTLHRRLDVHEASGIALAQWLEARPEVTHVFHPALPSHPQHSLWQRDFSGACGLFSIIVDWHDPKRTSTFIDTLSLHGLGYSWGGFESLCLPAWPKRHRTATPWPPEGQSGGQFGGQLLRFHVGLEALDDLKADIEAGFAAAANLA